MKLPWAGHVEALARRPVAMVFATAFNASVLGAIANCAVLVLTYGVGRIGRLEPAAIVARLPGVGWAHRASAPAWLGSPWDLTRPGTAAEFLAPAFALYLAFDFTAALALAAVVSFRSRRPHEARGRGSLWLGVYAAALIALLFVPATQAVVHGALAVPVWRPVSKATALASVGAVALLIPLVRNPRRVGLLFRVATLVSSAALGLGFAVAVASAVTDRIGRPAAPVEGPRAPNVLLVSIDTLRADHVHCYGYGRETTPTIDALAGGGVRFTTAISPTSWTLPAHLTLMTGLPPEAHGVTDDRKRLGAGSLTLAEVLRRHGYDTAGFISGPYLAAGYGFLRGFDVYDDRSVAGTFVRFRTRRDSAAVVQAVRSWLDSRGRAASRRSFFIFVHMFDCHAEYAPPPPFDTIFAPRPRDPSSGHAQGAPPALGGPDARRLGAVVLRYDGAIRYTDSCLGWLIEDLRTRGVLDDTVVVVTADHGEEFLEHGQMNHEHNLYDTSVRVPLVMRYPRALPAGAVIAGQVRLMDVPATVLALAGASSDRFGRIREHGPRACVDLLPLLGGAGPAPRLVAFGDLHGTLASVRTERFVLVRHGSGPVGEELYDLASDPGEQRNVAAANQAVRAEMESALGEWRQLWHGAGSAAATFVPEADHLKRLRALGYM